MSQSILHPRLNADYTIDGNDLLTVADIARLMGVSRLTIKRRVYDGTLQSLKINSRGDHRFHRHDVEKYISSMRGGAIK